MNEDVARLIERVPQKVHARYRDDVSFAQQFEQGVVHIVVDLKLEREADPFRVWIAHRSKAAARRGAHDLMMEIFDKDDNYAQARALIADMAIENVEGIKKGWMGRGVFQSFVSHEVLEMSPPFCWSTGKQAIDASVYRCQCLQNGLNNGAAPGHEAFRHATSADTLAIIRGLRWTVHPSGFFVEPLNNRVKLLDALIGPL